MRLVRSSLIALSGKGKKSNPENPPDLVISADTIVILPSQSPTYPDQILEKPGNKQNHLKMLEEQNGQTVKCITGVNIIYPTLQNPGFAIRYAKNDRLRDSAQKERRVSTRSFLILGTLL